MNNTRNRPDNQEKINHQHNQQQKTRHEPVPKKLSQDPNGPRDHQEHHEQERPETRMTR